MSIADDVRGYADAAMVQGKKTVETAQARLAGLAGDLVVTAAQLPAKAEAAATTLKAIAEPYLAPLAELRDTVAGKADELVADVRKDPRVAAAYGRVESVLGSVTERVVTPALGRVPSVRASKPAPKRATAAKPATARPATAKAAAKPAASKSPAKKAPAKKAPAKKATARS